MKWGTSFICLLVDLNGDVPYYIATAISSNRLSSFIKGQVELREILSQPQSKEWYTFVIDNEQISASRAEFEIIPEQFLPGNGFYLNNEIVDNSSIVQEVVEKDNAVIHLALSDDKDEYSIDADDLGDVVKLYSIMLENSYKKGLIEHKAKNKKALIIPMNYKLRAFAASRASFNIHLYSPARRRIQKPMFRLLGVVSDYVLA